MSQFRVHSIDSAPEKSRPALEQLQQNFGLIPSVAGVMAASPTLLGGFAGVFQQVHHGTFNEAEIQVLLLSNAVTNQSAWAVAFHSALALKEGVAHADVEAIREARAPASAKPAALFTLTRALLERRGRLGKQELDAFRSAGFDAAQVFEVILVLAASLMTNYSANLAQPELEAPFREFAWVAP